MTREAVHLAEYSRISKKVEMVWKFARYTQILESVLYGISVPFIVPEFPVEWFEFRELNFTNDIDQNIDQDFLLPVILLS